MILLPFPDQKPEDEEHKDPQHRCAGIREYFGDDGHFAFFGLGSASSSAIASAESFGTAI
jgi:hypothetical protein